MPGAGQYEVKKMIGKESISRSIGEKREMKASKGELGPGPAGYFMDKPKNHNVSYSMGNRLEDLEFKAKNFQPGPGRYEHSVTKSVPSMKFGTGDRSDMSGGKETLSKPGPGNYSTVQS